MKLDAVTKALGLDVNLIVSVQMTETSFEPPAKRKRSTSAAELSSLSTAQRATNLLERGCFPLFQPARREWTEEKTITLKASETSLLWPPLTGRTSVETPSPSSGKWLPISYVRQPKIQLPW